MLCPSLIPTRGIGRDRYISTLDLCKGYGQIPLERKSREYTTCRTPMGLFQFTTMPFGHNYVHNYAIPTSYGPCSPRLKTNVLHTWMMWSSTETAEMVTLTICAES